MSDQKITECYPIAYFFDVHSKNLFKKVSFKRRTFGGVQDFFSQCQIAHRFCLAINHQFSKFIGKLSNFELIMRQMIKMNLMAVDVQPMVADVEPWACRTNVQCDVHLNGSSEHWPIVVTEFIKSICHRSVNLSKVNLLSQPMIPLLLMAKQSFSPPMYWSQIAKCPLSRHWVPLGI